MKIKILLTAAVIGVATLSANAGIHFGFSFGIPFPVVAAPVYAAPVYAAPVYAPAPVVVATPVYAAPVYAPVCPGPGYAWAPGYWSVNTYGRVWIPGCWRYGGGYGHGYGYGYGHGGWDHDGRGHGGGWHR